MTIRKLEKADWKPYLDQVSERIGGHRYAKIETASPHLGAQTLVSSALLQGIAYDTADDLISFFCEGLSHNTLHPRELYVDDLLGDPSSLAVMADDGSLQIVTFRPLLALPGARRKTKQRTSGRSTAPGQLLGAPRWPRALDEWLGERRPLEVSAPSLDVTETDGAYLIRAEVPGVRKQDLSIEFRDGVLTLRGEKKMQRDREDERGRILERSYGVFARSLQTPEEADPDQVSASLQDGVLRIEIRKHPGSRSKVILIEG